MRSPKSVAVSLNLPFGLGGLTGTWEPDDNEREAAWEMYVEFVTRVTVVELGPDEGLLREALTSLYSLFATTRAICASTDPQWHRPRERAATPLGSSPSSSSTTFCGQSWLKTAPAPTRLREQAPTGAIPGRT